MKIIQVFICTIAISFFMPDLLLAQPFETEDEWKIYFKNKSKKNNLDKIEGIWNFSEDLEVVVLNNTGYGDLLKSKVFIYKIDENYSVYFLGAEPPREYQLVESSTSGMFLLSIKFINTNSLVTVPVILTNSGLIKYEIYMPSKELDFVVKKSNKSVANGTSVKISGNLLKLFPKEDDYSETFSTTGSGLGISSNGIIITNFHVIEGAKTIKVRGINSNLEISYNGKIILCDKNNDLALIKIEDNRFSTLGKIPFSFKKTQSKVGENIFVLGYPLIGTMGDEIKLTNGIISSNCGYQGDVTSYQISAPVQPGNSGGPLFDKQGNVIGLITSKHLNTENVSYAIKNVYLMSLIESLVPVPKFPTENLLLNKTLSQQFDILKKYVYIIETTK
jgi:S1-C subfamily serine protease